jgi:hypothetical protein
MPEELRSKESTVARHMAVWNLNESKINSFPKLNQFNAYAFMLSMLAGI